MTKTLKIRDNLSQNILRPSLKFVSPIIQVHSVEQSHPFGYVLNMRYVCMFKLKSEKVTMFKYNDN